MDTFVQDDNFNKIGDQNNPMCSDFGTCNGTAKKTKKWQVATVLATLALVICGGFLVYTIIKYNDSSNKSNTKLKEVEAKVMVAEEVIAKYEAAKKTKADEVISEGESAVQKIVTPIIYDTNFKELSTNIRDRNLIINSGEVYTDPESKYLIADMGVISMSLSENNNDIYEINMRSGVPSVWYRELPSEKWILAFEGNGVPICKDFKKIWTHLKTKSLYSDCIGDNGENVKLH